MKMYCCVSLNLPDLVCQTVKVSAGTITPLYVASSVITTQIRLQDLQAKESFQIFKSLRYANQFLLFSW